MTKIISKRGKSASEPLPQEETNAILSEQMQQEDVDVLFDLSTGDDEDAYDGWLSSGLQRREIVWCLDEPETPQLGDAVLEELTQTARIWVGTRWVRMTYLQLNAL